MNAADLQPRRHDPPEGWTAEIFEAVTSALAAALVAAVRRAEEARHRVEAREDGAR